MFDETKDIKIFGSMRKIRRATGTGFTYCHPACLSFSIFKASIDEWPDQLSPWSSYAKFISIYPEHTDQLMYIVQNIANIKANKMYRDIIVSNIATIIQTRETNYTPRIKSKISKFQKVINKAKNRIRNIWDLILQNNLLEMNKSIKSAMKTIKECEVDINNMMMLHSNNRFVARQYAKYCLEIHADGAEFKEWSENIRKLQMGQKVKPDVIHDLAMGIFPNIPAHSLNKEDMKYSVTDEMEGEAVDEPIEDNPDIELIDVLNNQVKKHKVPAIVFMYWSTIAMFVIFVAVPIIAIMIYFPKYIIDLQEPLTFLNGISYLRNLINVMASMAGKYILEEMYDERIGEKIMQKNQLEKGFPMTAFGGYTETNMIIYYLASQVSYANELMSKIRSYKAGNSFIERARTTLFTSNLNFSYFLAYNQTTNFNASTDQIAIMVSLHVGKLAEIGEMSPDIARGTDALTCRNNNIVPTQAMSKALDIVNEYILNINARDKKIFLSLMIVLIILCCFGYIILFNVQIKKLRKNNMDIMGIFSTIPKTVISTVSASFNHVKKNDTSNAEQTEQQRHEDEMSRQEESIMKLFSTISDGTSQATNAQKNQFCFFIIAVCASIGYYLTIIRFLNASNTMKLWDAFSRSFSRHITQKFSGAQLSILKMKSSTLAFIFQSRSTTSTRLDLVTQLLAKFLSLV
ncbi:hypothetical protein TVAG_298400 [Trichomonas vaginalis G3]|uniref:Uncharacterized protein n=1 Tax=Trichomonas vaginalis (strain ATCC PRA-98 / G3) TaxID=412133 RepID=A2ET31_TRIV3|nr:guanylate cyclase protein [Trichomonas vaginalis G3]EAY04220.1 hypothetical protein TVAG_298400 [Trichomonas vaginalis G3]KAI5493094.1 guanylate cyclase protein [Trichomonas vaginalis G3]|eukprot:XP_001316443.1 hypothetical protein [Trichomonas vaginalis G3]